MVKNFSFGEKRGRLEIGQKIQGTENKGGCKKNPEGDFQGHFLFNFIAGIC